jgi:hypothetical protein
MTERSDIATDWSESPRIIEVASPSVDLTMQDLHDTCRSDTLQPGEGDDTLDNMDDDFIIDSAGKEDLGGGVLVGITSTLQNAQVAFESRLTPIQTGTITNPDAGGTLFEDSAALLITNGVKRGDVLINFDDESITEFLEVLTETTGITRVLRAGTANDYGNTDAYKIWPVIQCELEGGNLVANDDAGDPLSAIFPTAFTQIVRTSSSSATLQEQADIQFASFQGGVWVDITSVYAGTVFPTGTPRQPVNNLTDALAIAAVNGLTRFFIIGDITVSIGPDFTGITWEGESENKSTITIPAGATVTNCEFEEAELVGTLDGISTARRCLLSAIEGVQGEFFECGLAGPVTLGSSGEAVFIEPHSTVAGGGPSQTPEIIVGSGCSLAIRGYYGGIELSGKGGADAVSVDMNSGQVVIADDNTAGTITLRGVAKWTNRETYAGTTVVNDELVTAAQLQEVWRILGLDKLDPVDITPGGVDSDSGDIDINFSGDGVTLTRMVRQ